MDASENLNKTARFWVQEQTDQVKAAIEHSQGKFHPNNVFTNLSWVFSLNFKSRI